MITNRIGWLVGDSGRAPGGFYLVGLAGWVVVVWLRVILR